MANTTIDGLTPASALTGTEEVPVWQGTVTKKTTTQDIADLAVVPPTPAADTIVETLGNMTVAWAYADFPNNNWSFFRQNSVGEASVSGTWDHDPTVSYLSALQQRTITSAAAVNSPAEFHNAQHLQDMYRKVSSGAGGGFQVIYCFRFSSPVAGNRFFFGVSPYNDTTALSGSFEPSSRPDLCGISKDSTDTNFQFLTSRAAGNFTKVDTGITPATVAGKSCRFTMTVPRGGATATITIVDMDTGTTLYSATTTFGANAPATDTDLHPLLGRNSGSSSNAVSFSLHKMVHGSNS